jgi:hypothetical protein
MPLAVRFSIVPYSFAVCLPYVSRLLHTHLPSNFRLTFGYHIPDSRLINTPAKNCSNVLYLKNISIRANQF